MKKFIKIAFFACIQLLFLKDALSQEKRFDPNPSFPSAQEVGTAVAFHFNIYKHFHEKFPGDEIEGDLTQEIKKEYPNLKPEEISKTQDSIRKLVKLYRVGEYVYSKYLESKLAPEAPTLVVDDSQYDDTDYKYIESDEPLVIQDFKKVLSYGSKKSDYDAYKLRKEKQTISDNDDTGFAQLAKMFSKEELSNLLLGKTPSYIDKRGLGEWFDGNIVDARIISSKTAISDDAKYLINFELNPQYVLVSEDNLVSSKTEFDFSKSENIKDIKIQYSMPTRFSMLGFAFDLVGYWGNFAIPIEFDVIDKTKPIKLSAAINASICNNDGCTTEKIYPEAVFDAGKVRDSLVSAYVNTVVRSLPKLKVKKAKLQSFVIEEDRDDNQYIKVVVDNNARIKNMDLFVSANDGTLLEKPNIAVNNNNIYAKIYPINRDKNLVGKSYSLMLKINDDISLKAEIIAKKASIIEADGMSFNLGLLLLAIIGGFILNFMPCVFPVLSLKLIGFTNFGAKKEENVIRDFSFIVLGIYAAFAVIIIVLSALKLLGYQLGWGIQFQSISFLVFMVFVIVAFISKIGGSFKTPKFVEDVLYKSKYSKQGLNFFTGMFLVLLATPCTAPYLATVLGFALSGTYWQMIVLLAFVGIGLSMPYLAIISFPYLIHLLPKVGTWVKYVNAIMSVLLALTIAWLLSIIYVQTSLYFILRLIGYAALFMYVLYFYNLLLVQLDAEKLELDKKQKISNWIRIGLVIVAGSIVFWALADAREAYNTKRAEIVEVQKDEINESLIEDLIKNGDTILLEIGANWCLTCKVNDFNVLENPAIQEFLKDHNVVVFKIDWTNYDKKVLDYMEKFGRKGIPFYVVFSPKIPNGMVLPEILSESAFRDIILSM